MASEVFRIIKVLRKTVGASEKQMLRVLGLPLFSRRDRGVSEDRPGRAGACRPTAGASWIHRPSGRVLRIKNREAVPGENREILTLKGLERSRAKKGDLLLSSAGSGFFPEQEGCFLLMPPEDQGQTTGGREALSARLRIDGERERKRERESEREAKPEALSFRLEQTDDPGVRVRKYVLLKEGRLRLTLEEPYPLDIGRRYRMGEFLLRCLAPGKSIRVREKVRRKISGESPGAGGLRLFKELKPKREDLWEEALRGKGFLYASSERKQWYGKNYSSFLTGKKWLIVPEKYKTAEKEILRQAKVPGGLRPGEFRLSFPCPEDLLNTLLEKMTEGKILTRKDSYFFSPGRENLSPLTRAIFEEIRKSGWKGFEPEKKNFRRHRQDFLILERTGRIVVSPLGMLWEKEAYHRFQEEAERRRAAFKTESPWEKKAFLDFLQEKEHLSPLLRKLLWKFLAAREREQEIRKRRSREESKEKKVKRRK